jgi:hypothetical protein
MIFEDRHKLGSPVDLDTAHLEGRVAEKLVEQVLAAAGGSFGRDMAERPFGDRVVGGEVLDRPARADGPRSKDVRVGGFCRLRRFATE